MSDTCTISEAAARTGFTASALRFYERAGLIAPARTDAGYRTFDQRAVERLRFIARGKELGLSLEEIAELVELWDGDRCEPVAHRLRALLGEKVADTERRIAELVAFGRQLQTVGAALTSDPADGPCSETCACQVAAADSASAVACTLSPEQATTRVADWRALLARSSGSVAVDGGRQLRFPPDPELAARVGALAAAEQSCCTFFTFVVRIDAAATELTVTAPPEAGALVEALFEVPS